MQGWITCFAWISTLAGVANTTAFMLQSLVAANHPDYEPQAWHVTLLIFALLIVGGLMNMYIWFLIPWLETLAGLLHIVLFVIFVVVLVTLAPRHSAEFVFTKSVSSSGWSNQFISFNMGLMTPTWGFVGKSRTRARPLRLMSMINHSVRLRWRRPHVGRSTQGSPCSATGHVLDGRSERSSCIRDYPGDVVLPWRPRRRGECDIPDHRDLHASDWLRQSRYRHGIRLTRCLYRSNLGQYCICFQTHLGVGT